MRTIDFRSDNVACVAPQILHALARANPGTAAPYGEDDLSRELDARFSELFGAAIRVFPVSTGTAANALSLASIAMPWGGIYCHELAHAHTSEGGATEHLSGGAKFIPLAGAAGKLDAMALQEALANADRGQTNRPQPAALTITQATELGTVYQPGELHRLCDTARSHGLRIHMDGARLANAVAALGCRPAEITGQLGIDVLSFGATKNGGLCCDAIVVFDPALAAQLGFRLRRAGQVWSKMRFAAAQLLAYVEDGLWLRLAGRANALARRLGAGLQRIEGVRLVAKVEANLVFAELPETAILAMQVGGVLVKRRQRNVIRMVCRFDGTEDEVDYCLAVLRDGVPAGACP